MLGELRTAEALLGVALRVWVLCCVVKAGVRACHRITRLSP